MTKIEYLDVSWNPTHGCTPIATGCKNCWAARRARRLVSMGVPGYPADDPFRVTCRPDRLAQPLKWRKPRQVGVSFMGDLFHDDVPDEFIDRVFDVMWHAHRHTFVVLTKRYDRLVNYVLAGASRRAFGWTELDRWPMAPGDYEHIDTLYYRNQCGYVDDGDDEDGGTKSWACKHPENEECGQPESCGERCCPIADCADTREDLEALEVADDYTFVKDADGSEYTDDHVEWVRLHGRPRHAMCSNVWLGFSASTQREFEDGACKFQRLRNPYQMLFCSLEPLCEQITLQTMTRPRHRYCPDEPIKFYSALRQAEFSHGGHIRTRPYLDQIIVGGESGPGSRPMHPDWVRSIRDDCVAAGVPFYFKQWGDWAHTDCLTDETFADLDEAGVLMGEQPEEFYRVGKKKAGRELDGRTWDEMPSEAAEKAEEGE